MTHDCDGYLIWDYFTGDIVCSKCGTVVGRIYDYGPQRMTEDRLLLEQMRLKQVGKPKNFPNLKRYNSNMELYRKASKIAKKKGFEVDYDKLLENKKFLYVFKTNRTIKAIKNVKENNLMDKINYGLEVLEKSAPHVYFRLTAWTDRAKYAIGYYIYMVLNGEKPHYKKMISMFNISETHYRRISKIAEEVLEIIKK